LIVDFAIEPNSGILELYGELYEEKGDAANAVTRYGKAIELLLQHPEPGLPTLHEELFDKVKSLAPDNPILPKLSALMNGKNSVETPAPAAAQSSPEFSWIGAAPDDPWKVPSKTTPPQDRHFQSRAGTCAGPSEPLGRRTKAVRRAAVLVVECPPDEQWEIVARRTGYLSPVLSTSEQFRSYVEAGQHSEAEEWLSHLVTAQPDNAEARELFGHLLEAKGDTAGAALQYSRALELLLVHPNNESPTQPAGLYAKVKELAPPSLVAKWPDVFAEAAGVSTCRETPVSASPGNEIDPEAHYTLEWTQEHGVAGRRKKNFALDEEPRLFLDSVS
jgi:tetratricopeptide (TPR) repeat protein